MDNQNNSRIHHLTHGMLAIMLLSTSAMAEVVQDQYASDIQPQNMAEEILIQGESALAQMTLGQRMSSDWHQQGQDTLASQTQQQPSEPLIATIPDCTEKKSSLANSQPLPNVSGNSKQAKG